MKKSKKRELLMYMKGSKKPSTLDNHVGVEIEFITTTKKSVLLEEFETLGIKDNVTIGTDGSISVNGNSCTCDFSISCDCEDYMERKCYNASCREEQICFCDFETEHFCECECGSHQSYELRVIAKETNINDVINVVCKVLNKYQCETNVTCGLHVHLDARNRDVQHMYKNLVSSLSILKLMVPRSRQENEYCEINNSKSFRKAVNYYERYMAINAQSYKENQTIEVRLHSGTTNAIKINNWINLLLKIVKTRNVYKYRYTKPSDFFKRVKLDKELRFYIKQRIKTFKKKENKNSGEEKSIPEIRQAA